MSCIVYSEPAQWPVTCFKLWRYGENIGDKKLSVEQTLDPVKQNILGQFTVYQGMQ